LFFQQIWPWHEKQCSDSAKGAKFYFTNRSNANNAGIFCEKVLPANLAYYFLFINTLNGAGRRLQHPPWLHRH